MHKLHINDKDVWRNMVGHISSNHDKSKKNIESDNADSQHLKSIVDISEESFSGKDVMRHSSQKYIQGNAIEPLPFPAPLHSARCAENIEHVQGLCACKSAMRNHEKLAILMLFHSFQSRIPQHIKTGMDDNGYSDENGFQNDLNM